MSLYIKKRKKFLKKVIMGACLFLIGVSVLLLFNFGFRDVAVSLRLDHPFFPLLLMTIISLAAFKPLDIAMNQLFRNFLFKKKSYPHMALMHLAEEITLVLELKELANLVVNTFGDILHLKSVALVVPSSIREDYEIASAFGWNVSDARRIRLPKDSALIELMKSSGPHVLVRDRVVRTLPWQEANRLAHDFDAVRASWVIPLFVKKEFMGAIAFASSSPESIFDEADFQFFREFADSVAKSLRNALNVSELQKANQELQDVQSQVLQSTKLTAIEQLATGIAHEIHNPLTIISGKAQVLLLQKERNQMDERVEEVLKTIVKQTKRAADITRKLLMFSQSSGAPKEMLKFEQVLEDTISLVSYQTSLEGIEITRTLGSNIPPFYANVHEMREVFLNLILNAVQSVGTQGKIHCEVHYRSADQVIEVQIADTGVGIATENIEKLFNPFFTTRRDAVGLGLFVTKQIVHRYGGSIRVESLRERGSLFIIQLPCVEKVGTSSEQDESFSIFGTKE